MADVLITVGMTPDLDFSEFEKELEGVISKYESGQKKYPIEVSFELSKASEASLKNLDASLKEIQSRALSTAAALKTINGSSGANTQQNNANASKNAAIYRDNAKAIKEYFDALKKYRTLETDITQSGGRYSSGSGKWSQLAKELNETAAAYGRVSESAKALPESMGNNLTNKMLAAQREYDLWLEQFQNRRDAAEQKRDSKNEDAVIERRIKLEKQIATLQQKVGRYLTNYSAAKGITADGNTKAAYSGLVESQKVLEGLAEMSKTGEIDNLTDKFDAVTGSVERNREAIQRSGKDHKSFVSSFSNVTQKLTTWVSASQMIMGAIRSMRQMAKEAVEVDTALNQMQIVTKASSSQMQSFGDTASKVAKETHSSMADVINSVTTYARLGYNMNESTILAEYTSKLSKVGDIDVASTQSAVTAIVKAFQIDVKDVNQVRSVFDQLVTVGNNFPVSVKELAEGLNNASSSLAAAGNSYEQSLAMLAAANATVQDISKSSTGLRTIVARIRNTKTELDDLGESMTDVEYNNIVEALTKYKVTLKDGNGNLRSTFEIMTDIAKVAKELKENSPNDYAALAETLAGTRMQNIFYSLVENFGEAEKAMGMMGQSVGALDDAFSTYSSSIQAHIDTLKASFQELSVAVVDSGLANGLIDIGTGILSFLTALTKAGLAIPTLTALLGAIQSIKSIS